MLLFQESSSPSAEMDDDTNTESSSPQPEDKRYKARVHTYDYFPHITHIIISNCRGCYRLKSDRFICISRLRYSERNYALMKIYYRCVVSVNDREIADHTLCSVSVSIRLNVLYLNMLIISNSCDSGSPIRNKGRHGTALDCRSTG